MSRVFDALMQLGRRTAGDLGSEERALLATFAIAPADTSGKDPASASPAPPESNAAPGSGTGPREADSPETIADLVRTVEPRLAPKSPIFPDGFRRAVEQYRIARTKVAHHQLKPRVLAISSPDVGDGKSTTALNLGWALSRIAEKRVLVGDVDFRRCSVARALSIPSSPGLADVLRRSRRLSEAIVQIKGQANLYVIPAGESCTDSSELLSSGAWEAAVREIRNQFDYVVFDCPPVGMGADYEVIVRECDGVVLVLQPDHTRRELCYRAIESCRGDKFVGVVLNNSPEFFLYKEPAYDRYMLESRWQDEEGPETHSLLARRSTP